MSIQNMQTIGRALRTKYRKKWWQFWRPKAPIILDFESFQPPKYYPHIFDIPWSLKHPELKAEIFKQEKMPPAPIMQCRRCLMLFPAGEPCPKCGPAVMVIAELESDGLLYQGIGSTEDAARAFLRPLLDAIRIPAARRAGIEIKRIF